ncbi:hypothetical protein HXZ94_14190 [Empedobacter falsenii]|nr:hypothetical protein [Empedobacter falsenii]MDM1299643.1 hypothetical protein [Empedobacter falsenii]MDM1319436.1 hypothetical protein [Empedobacter falsenii]
MKKSINAFQVEKLEDRKEFIFYCLLHLLCTPHKCTIDNDGGTGTPGR